MSLVALTRRGKPRQWHRIRHVIDPDVLENYIAQANKDHEYVKQYSKGDLYRRLPRLRMYTTPRLHQLQAFYLTTYYRSFLLFMDMGAGKTKVVLDTIRYRKQHHGMRAALIFTINLVAAKTWVDECAKHAPDLTIKLLQGPITKRIAELESGTADLYVTNHHAVLGLMGKRVEKLNKKREPTGRFNYKTNSKAIKRIVPKIDTLVIDEAHMVTNTNARMWTLFEVISKRMRFRYGLTGTPFGRDPLPLFGQFKLIDQGETFGTELNKFRATFYDYERGYFGGTYKFNRKMEPALNKMIRNRSIRYETTDFSDLPPVVQQSLFCKQTPQMLKVYREQVEEMMRQRGSNKLESAFVNLRQCTSGYQTLVKGGEDQRQLELLGLEERKREYVHFANNPKLEALEGLIQGLPFGAKFMIFAEYRHTVEMLSEMLSRLHVGHVKLYGGVKDKIAVLDKFYDDPKCLALVANNVSASMSINPQHVCHYMIFFESSTRPTIRQQAEKRLHRPGQKYTVFIYDILIRNSVDSKIVLWLQQGKDLLKALLERGAQRTLF